MEVALPHTGSRATHNASAKGNLGSGDGGVDTFHDGWARKKKLISKVTPLGLPPALKDYRSGGAI